MLKHPEMDFAGSTIGEIVDRFLANGCVLLRHFTEPPRAAELLTVSSRLYGELRRVHVFEQDFIERGFPSISRYVFSQRHWQLLRTVFGEYPFEVSAGGTHTRRISPPSATERWQQPLGFHIDAVFHSFAFTVNFWVPLRPCGVAAPSLAVVPAPFDEILEYTEFDGKPAENEGEGKWMFHHFKPVVGEAASAIPAANAEIRRHFGERVWTPAYEVGDAMMLSNWTIHGTHATPEMDQSRENVELRFVSPASLAEVRAAHAAA